MKEQSDKQIYDAPDQLRSCDKGGHLERSIVDQPVHLKSPKVKALIDQAELERSFQLQVIRQNLAHLKGVE
jgi:hypothetical protein